MSTKHNFKRVHILFVAMSVSRRIFVLLTLVMTLDSAPGLRFPVTMPYVNPQLPNEESYLCTGVAVQTSR